MQFLALTSAGSGIKANGFWSQNDGSWEESLLNVLNSPFSFWNLPMLRHWTVWRILTTVVHLDKQIIYLTLCNNLLVLFKVTIKSGYTKWVQKKSINLLYQLNLDHQICYDQFIWCLPEKHEIHIWWFLGLLGHESKNPKSKAKATALSPVERQVLGFPGATRKG